MASAWWSNFKDSLFAIFYIMTEQNDKHTTGSILSTISCTLIYLIDAGQVIRAVITSDFGWDGLVVGLIGKVDMVNVFFKVVIVH